MNDANDFPLAKILNSVALAIATSIRSAEELDLPEDFEITELNHSYVLLVQELEALYDKNPKLSSITPAPFWRRFDILRTKSWQILDFLDDPINDKGQAHLLQLEKLCIIAGNEAPELSSQHIKLVEQVLVAVKNYRQRIDNARLEKNAEIEDSWNIPKYWVDYTNGVILINGVLKLKKTHIGSAIDMLLEQAFKHPNTLFTPTLPSTARNLSTLLSSAGFNSTLRELFFPTVSTSKGVLFRPTVSSSQAHEDNIDTEKLDLILLALDADHTFSA